MLDAHLMRAWCACGFSRDVSAIAMISFNVSMSMCLVLVGWAVHQDAARAEYKRFGVCHVPLRVSRTQCL